MRSRGAGNGDEPDTSGGERTVGGLDVCWIGIRQGVAALARLGEGQF